MRKWSGEKNQGGNIDMEWGKKKKDPSSEVKIPSADILFMEKVVGGTYLYLSIMLEEK